MGWVFPMCVCVRSRMSVHAGVKMCDGDRLLYALYVHSVKERLGLGLLIPVGKLSKERW